MLWGCVEASGTGNISWLDRRMDSVKFQRFVKKQTNTKASVQKLKQERG